MSLAACAEIVRKGDPERFLAAMAAPPEARAVLFPLYAFNLEVARAAYVTEEAMIAEMRLQWWRDVLQEIAEGAPVRSHEVTVPLAQVLDAHGARLLDDLVAARRWDVYREAFEDQDGFEAYLRATAGRLMWVAARALGAERDGGTPAEGSREAVEDFGTATGFVRFLRAVPELEARGRVPLVDGRPEAIAVQAGEFLRALPGRMALRRRLAAAAHPAVFEGWMTAPLLRQIERAPGRVASGGLGLSPFREKLRLLRWSF